MALAVSKVMVGEELKSSSTEYVIQEFIGEGGFGIVARCLDVWSTETVAVKIIKAEHKEEAMNEVDMLQTIGQLNAKQTNIVKFYEWFQHLDFICLVFEMLDKSLFDLVISQKFGPMCVDQIRPIAKQVLVALEALHSLNIIHADIKPDNVMLISMEGISFRVKLIDFGLALYSDRTEPKVMCQAIGYRAPEISLGLPYSVAIDMWGLGCSLAFFYLGYNLFDVHCEYLMMKKMMQMLGMPLDHQLQNGLNTRRLFCKDEDITRSKWRLLTPKEFREVNGKRARKWSKDSLTSLDQLVYLCDDGDAAEVEDRWAFIDLLEMMLHMDEEKRISPTEALQHPFITMTHLKQDPDNTDYLTKAQTIMDNSSMEISSPHRLTETCLPSKVGVGDFEKYPSLSTDQSGKYAAANVSQDQDQELQRSTSTDKDYGVFSAQDPSHHCCEKPADLVVSSNGLEMQDIFSQANTTTIFLDRIMKIACSFFSRLWNAVYCFLVSHDKD